MAGLLLVIAHPDDEIFCSGLLAHLSANEIPIHIVCVTRGEGGQVGYPPITSKDLLPSVREGEMRLAAAVLNASNLVFLNYVDPEPDGTRLRAPDHIPDQLQKEIQDQIRKFDAEVIMTHGSTGDYGHPAHVLVHQMTKVAAKKTDTTLYSFNAFFVDSGRPTKLNRNDWATFLFDGSAYCDIRFESFLKHQTQWSVFAGEQSDEEAYRVALRKYFTSTQLESYCRHVSQPDSDVMPNWVAEYSREPAGASGVVRAKYKIFWTAREFARSMKRKIVG